jgi:hypothetical protein
MEDNVVQLPGTERNVVPLQLSTKIPASEILEYWQENNEEIDTIFIIMKNRDGSFVMAGSEPILEDVLTDIKRAERRILDMIDDL